MKFKTQAMVLAIAASALTAGQAIARDYISIAGSSTFRSLDIGGFTPDIIEQLPAAVNPVWVGHEEFQQTIFRGPDLYLAVVDHYPVTGGIKY